MGIRNVLISNIDVKITCPSVSDMLTKIGKAYILMDNISAVDQMVFCCKIRRCDYQRLKTLVQKSGSEIEIIKKTGVFWLFQNLMSRYVFLIGMTLLLVLSLYIPTRILFVHIEGNKTLSSYQILEAANRCGLSFGASRRNVRSEKMKNALLDALPQLQWAGVNTYGCVAVITVKEREINGKSTAKHQVSDIIAVQDGIINQIAVTKGTPICEIGQVVSKGEKLVSGYTDCGRVIRAERSVGEIFAYTNRRLTVITPNEILKKTAVTENKSNLSLQIGKKLINLSQDSGISDVTCDKIYKAVTLTLPGGFKLPVSILYTQRIARETEICNACYNGLEETATKYLKEHMVSGKILNSNINVMKQNDITILDGIYYCNEMIGKEQYEGNRAKYE